jgi:hypothetical protein
MQWSVESNSPQDAEYKLRGKIVVDAIKPAEDKEHNSEFEFLNSTIFGDFKNQKQGK